MVIKVEVVDVGDAVEYKTTSGWVKSKIVALRDEGDSHSIDLQIDAIPGRAGLRDHVPRGNLMGNWRPIPGKNEVPASRQDLAEAEVLPEPAAPEAAAAEPEVEAEKPAKKRGK